MSESTRNETQLGLADLTKRFSAAGLNIIDQRERFHHDSTYFVIGTHANQTNIVISRDFLDDLPNTREFQDAVDSYARAVAGRLKCGSPEVFYCRSGVAVRVSIRWPIQAAMYNNKFETFVLMDVINQADGQIALCSMEAGHTLGHTVFDVVIQTVNSVRMAVDEGLIKFYNPNVRQETYQRIKRQQQPPERCPQPEIGLYLRGKAYLLGFLVADEPNDVWAVDPWDAQYLGVTKRELLLAMRVLRANGLFDSGSGPEYARPTDKLLAEHSSEKEGEEPQQKVSRLNLPTKDVLLKDMRTILERHPVSAILVTDADNFKSVNDSLGHSGGDECLDLIVGTIATIVGRRGKIYKWGAGDEFAVCLPNFSTEEAQGTAERIRRGIVEAKPGGEIAVTVSIGVCGSDRANSKSAEEILDFADKALYKSKNEGRNRVTAWTAEINSASPDAPTQKHSKKAIKAQLTKFVKEGIVIRDGIHYSNPESLRQKPEWERRVEEYLDKNLDESFVVRFQSPSHQFTSYPEGINVKMTAPWADTSAKMATLNDFMSELRD